MNDLKFACRQLLKTPGFTAVAVLVLFALFQLPMLLAAQEQRPSGPQRIAFTHATVIDATGAQAKRDMTVIIAGERIEAIGNSKEVPAPKDAQVVNATGKFLIPGLWDMHAHLGNDERDKTGYLQLCLANGVTGLRIMSGESAHYQWRKQIDQGSLAGPRLVIGSFVDDAKMTAAEARDAVQRGKQEGADFIKVHDQIPRDAYFALMGEARRLGIPVAGHVPKALRPSEAAIAGQKSIEHLTGVADAAPDETKATALFEVFRKNGTWHCPTLVMRRAHTIRASERPADDPRLKYVKPSWRKNWLNMQTMSRNFLETEWAKRREIIRNEIRLTGRLQKAGVGILAGTDATDWAPYVPPGFSVHDELAILVEAGLSPMEALQTATRNPAKFLNVLDKLGTVEPGKFADLVWLDADPLEDIRNTRKISAVVVRGRLHDRQALNQILAQVETVMSDK